MLNCAANVVDIFRCNLRPVSQFLQQDKNRRINFVDDPLLFVIRSKPPPHNKQEDGQKIQLYRDKVETSLLPDTLYQLDQPYFVRQPPTFTWPKIPEWLPDVGFGFSGIVIADLGNEGSVYPQYAVLIMVFFVAYLKDTDVDRDVFWGFERDV